MCDWLASMPSVKWLAALKEIPEGLCNQQKQGKLPKQVIYMLLVSSNGYIKQIMCTNGYSRINSDPVLLSLDMMEVPNTKRILIKGVDDTIELFS